MPHRDSGLPMESCTRGCRWTFAGPAGYGTVGGLLASSLMDWFRKRLPLPDGRGSDFLARVVTGPVAWRRAGTIGRERAIMAATWGHKENSWKTYMRYCAVIAPAWKICRTRGPAPGCGDRKTRYAAV